MEGTHDIYYFAYGSNMCEAEVAKSEGKFRTIGAARLDDHRLAFTRRSRTWQAGVADVVRSKGLSVWGVLYAIDETALRSLDVREGFHGINSTDNAYDRHTLTVCLVQKKLTIQAVTYVVHDKEVNEVPPSVDYLDRLITGAREKNLDEDYVNFLVELGKEPRSNFRQGRLVKPTSSRDGARGTPIVRVPVGSSGFKHGLLCAIQHANRTALAVAILSPDVSDDECEIDQSIRASLNVKSRFAFGFFVHLSQTSKRPNHWWVFQPRALTLPLHRPAMLDSEKNICILNRGNIGLMGIQEGSYVTITAARRAANGTTIVRSISRRVFCGSDVKLHQPDNIDLPYPTAQKFYLDLDGRLALGLSRDDDGVPVLIEPKMSRVFLENIVRYGVTLLVGLLAIQPLVDILRSSMGWSQLTGVFLTGAIAISTTFAITILDLRSRVRY